eukprot:c15403_g1_i1.p1 GENE.c15403_g1_i1~~c15403_g1_i1.p1  ORF type:complete len:140 (-),score=29.82 c15403_g1_i1:126-545(-)
MTCIGEENMNITEQVIDQLLCIWKRQICKCALQLLCHVVSSRTPIRSISCSFCFSSATLVASYSSKEPSERVDRCRRRGKGITWVVLCFGIGCPMCLQLARNSTHLIDTFFHFKQQLQISTHTPHTHTPHKQTIKETTK